jgi:hypothetical protein
MEEQERQRGSAAAVFLERESDEGNVEYKLKLLKPSPQRLVQLVTQLKYRLEEGGGEARYFIGVSDDGTAQVIPAACLPWHAPLAPPPSPAYRCRRRGAGTHTHKARASPARVLSRSLSTASFASSSTPASSRSHANSPAIPLSFSPPCSVPGCACRALCLPCVTAILTGPAGCGARIFARDAEGHVRATAGHHGTGAQVHAAGGAEGRG